MDDNPYNVEDNVHAPLLGRDLDSSTPLWRHHNPWIRIPTRFIVRVEETTHIGAFIVGVWYGVPQSVSAIGEELWKGIIACPAVLWRNRSLMIFFAIILFAGTLLVIQGSRGEFNILLVLLFAWSMVMFATFAKLSKRQESNESLG